MLRRLKKFTVYSSVIVAGQASRALDDAPFAGQDESKDAEGLLRRLSECDDDEVHIFGDCYDLDTTRLRIPPASPTPAESSPTPGQIGNQLSSASIEQQSITVSRAPARALRALSRRFWGCFASPAPLRVHRPTRASGDGAEGVERIESVRRRR